MRKRLTTEEFIQRARKIHGNRYDYSKVDYKTARIKVCIICPEHGEFHQKASNHTFGQGCSECRKIKISKMFALTYEQFIEKARKIHEDRYDYTKVDYVNGQIKVCIICPEHGEFWQSPRKHYSGNQGCPRCNSSKGEKDVSKWLDDHDIEYVRQKRFNNCRNKQPLPFDFHIFPLNIMIEYDGIQHFSPVDYFGGKEGFKRIQLHDNIKNKYCSNNNIKLIRIRYDESVDDILSNNL